MKPVLLILLGMQSAGLAQNWPQWRGPSFNGSSPAQNLPSHWNTTNGVAWIAPLPGYSGATPAIWNDHIFVSSPDPAKNLLLLCLDRRTGRESWRQVVSTGDREKGRNNTASPSPVTDGTNVFVMYATGDLAAFDYSGKKLWARDLGREFGPFANMWIYGSSPLLHAGRLYVQVLQRNPVPSDYLWATPDKTQRESFLLCLDPDSGKTLWRHLRATDAKDESQEAYSTPIPYETPRGPQLLIVGGNYVTGHHSQTGAELWRCGGLNPKDESWWRLVPSPVVAGDTLVVCAPKRDPVFGIKLHSAGPALDARIAWEFKEFPSDCTTPLFYQGKLYVLDGDRQMLTCLDPDNGQKLWQGSLGVREVFRASPTAADGKIYCVSEPGTVVVLDAGNAFKVLATIRMGEGPVRSSIALAGSHLYVRTARNLYAIGPAPAATP